MPDLVCSAAVQQITDESMPVRRHRNKVHRFRASEFNDLRRGIAHGENRLHFVALTTQFVGKRRQVFAVLFHLLAFPQLETLVVPRGPAVRDVDERELGVSQFRQLPDVAQDGLVALAIFDWNENVPIHA